MRSALWRRGHGRGAALLGALLVTACFSDRERPGPTGPATEPLLAAALQAPPAGATVLTGFDVGVRVWARDLNSERLDGVGFVVRRLGGGVSRVDSAAVRFAARNDTTHVFTFRVPDSLATNTQLDVYGIAYGTGGATRLSAPIHLVVVRCSDTVPVMCAPPRGP